MDSPPPYPPLFSLQVELRGPVCVVSIVGQLDIGGAPRLEQALQSVGESVEALVVDCSELTFMDSSGLNLIANHLRRCQRRGVRFALAGVTGEVAKTLEMSGLSTQVPMVDDPLSLDRSGQEDRHPGKP
jgi:anti-sigma B factor antagonist